VWLKGKAEGIWYSRGLSNKEKRRIGRYYMADEEGLERMFCLLGINHRDHQGLYVCRYQSTIRTCLGQFYE
jgi:hypothetical protein